MFENVPKKLILLFIVISVVLTYSLIFISR